MAKSRKERQLLAEKALAEKNYVLATEIFTKLYQERSSARANFFLVRSLAGQGEFKEAFEIAEEYLKSYLCEDDRFIFYIHVAVFAKNGIGIEKILARLTPYMTEYESRLFNTTLAKEVAEFSSIHPSNLKKAFKDIRYLGSLSPIKQRGAVQEAQQFSRSDFVKVAGIVMLDPNVHPLIRASFLNDLRLIKVQEKMGYLTFMHKRAALIPANLPDLEQMDFFKNYKNKLLDDADRPPDVSEQILRELTLKLMLLYPSYSEIKQNNALWYHILLDRRWVAANAAGYFEVASQLENSLAQWEPKQNR